MHFENKFPLLSLLPLLSTVVKLAGREADLLPSETERNDKIVNIYTPCCNWNGAEKGACFTKETRGIIAMWGKLQNHQMVKAMKNSLCVPTINFGRAVCWCSLAGSESLWKNVSNSVTSVLPFKTRTDAIFMNHLILLVLLFHKVKSITLLLTTVDLCF